MLYLNMASFLENWDATMFVHLSKEMLKPLVILVVFCMYLWMTLEHGK